MTDRILDDDHVACRICGRIVPYEKSRLFWSTDPKNPGTYRTCMKGDVPHTYTPRRITREQRADFEAAHVEGLHDEVSREGCSICDTQPRRI